MVFSSRYTAPDASMNAGCKQANAIHAKHGKARDIKGVHVTHAIHNGDGNGEGRFQQGGEEGERAAGVRAVNLQSHGFRVIVVSVSG